MGHPPLPLGRLALASLLLRAAVAVAQPADPGTDERLRRLEERLGQVEQENRAWRKAQADRDAAATVAASAQRPSVPLHASFDDGVVVASDGGDFRLHVGDLVQVDGRYFPGPQAAGVLDNFSLRSVRLDLDGSAWGVIDFRVEPDFGGGNLQLQYAYIDLRFIGQVRLRAGKFKVPFGLERQQPEGRTAFLERAFPTSISPNRDIGVALLAQLWDAAAMVELGVFNGAPDNSTVDLENDDDKEVAARLFFHPLRPTGIAALRDLGVGGAFSYGKLRGTVAAPLTNSIKSDGLNPFFRYVAGATPETTAIAAGERMRGTVQGYYYVGRLGLLAEYTWNSQQTRLGAVSAPTVTQAAQAYATLLLTRDRASFLGVRPARPIHLSRTDPSLGAFEIGFRYSRFWVDETAVSDGLVDLAKSARAASSYTVGLNWYLTGNVKLQLDYVRTDFSGGAAKGADRPSENLLAARLQHGF